MIREHFGQINQRFNPTNIQLNVHGSTKIAIKAVFGEVFLKTRTLGCDYYHINSETKPPYPHDQCCLQVSETVS